MKYLGRKRVRLPTIGGIIGSVASFIKYTLRDDFNDTLAAAAVNGTIAKPGPGTRTVVDTNSIISTAGGVLVVNGTPAASDRYHIGSVARTLGMVFKATLPAVTTIGAANVFRFGFSLDGTTNISYAPGLAYVSTTTVSIQDSGTLIYTTGSLGTAPHSFALVTRATGGWSFALVSGNWVMLYIHPTDNTATLFPKIIYTAANAMNLTVDNFRVPTPIYIPTPLCYDTFTRANGALGSSETLGPDTQVLSALSYRGVPVTLSLDGSGDVANCGSDSTLDALPNGASFTVEAWYRCSDITTGGGTERAVISKTNNTTTGWQISINGSDVLTATCRGWAGAPGSNKSTMKDNGIWHHVAGYFDTTAKTVRLAVDGTWQAASAAGGAYTTDASDNLTIGAVNAGAAWSMLGNIGWTRISLTDLYNGTAGTAFTPPAIDSPPATNSNTIEQWNATDGSGATLTASVKPSTNNGALTGATWSVAPWQISTNAAVDTPKLGSDVIVNGAFAADTNWSKGALWTIAAGVATATAASSDLTAAVAPLVLGAWYQTVHTITSFTSGTENVKLGTTAFPTHGSAATFTETGRATSTALAVTATAATLNIDNFSAKPLPLPELFSSVTTSTADVHARVAVTLDGALLGKQAGLVLNLDSISTPANFIIAYLDGNGNAVVDECVAGTYTNKISAAITYSAGAILYVIHRGTSLWLFYNNAQVGALQTMTANTNKLFGLFSTSVLCSLDAFEVWPDGGSGEYSRLSAF